MSKFDDTVDKLGKTTDKLDRVADKMASDSGGAAAKEQANEANRRADKTNTYLDQIASTLTGMSDETTIGSKESEAGGIFAGIARAIGGVGAGIGKGIGGFMMGIGKAAAFAPKFVIAMGALGLGIGAFMLAVGGAARLVSEVFPGLAENLKSFEGINGKNLVQVGLGMAAIGVGLGAQGIGGAISAVGGLIGGLADGISNMLGIESGPDSMLKKLELFGNAKINAEGVKRNAEALRAYGIAMTAAGGAKALGAIGSLAEGVFGGLGKMLGSVPPLEAMQKFGEAKVNHEGVKANADSMMAYLGAMALGTGASVIGAVGSLGGAVGSIMDGISGLFGGKGFLDTQIENMQKLSAAGGIDPEKIKYVASAMVQYLKVTTLGTGASVVGAVGSLGNAVSSFADGFSKLLGGKGTLDAQLEGMQKISAAKGIDPEKIKFVAGAMVQYAKAMSAGAVGEAGKAGGAIGNMVSNLADGITSFFGGKKSNPLDDLIKFSSIVITAEQVAQLKINADALVAYGMGMAKFAGTQVLKGGGDLLSGIAKGLSSFFGREEKVQPLEALQKFAEKMIDVATVENNVKALHAFAQLGLGYKQNTGMQKYIQDMGKMLPQVEALVNGAPATGVSILGKRIGKAELKGLASPDIKFEEAVTNIEKLKAMINMDMSGMPDESGGSSAPSPDQQTAMAKTDVLWAESLQKSIDGLAQTIANVNTGGNVSAPTNVTNFQAGNNSPTKPQRIGNMYGSHADHLYR